jgi:hypothetical protein
MKPNTGEKRFFTGMRPYLFTAAIIVICYALFALALGVSEGTVPR